MNITSFFNETELSLFHRQTGFTFGEFFRAPDGVLFAVDGRSGLVFIGSDLLKANVHGIGSVSSVRLEEDGVAVSFKDSSPVRIHAGGEDAAAFAAELGSMMEASDKEEAIEDTQAQTDVQEDAVEEASGILSGEELTEFYSRLANTGRSEAIGYLVSETGMNVKDACKYVDERDERKAVEESDPDYKPEFYRDGTMTKTAIIETVKKLKPGDRIHIEYKPLLGKLRVYDTEYRKLRIDTWNTKYFSLTRSADDYKSLMDDVAEDLFEYMDLFFFCEEKASEISCHLKRVTMLTIGS